MKLIRSLFLSLLFIFSFTFVTTVPAYAAVAANCDTSNSLFRFPTWYKYLDVGPRTTTDKNGTQHTDECAIIGPEDTDGHFSFEFALPRIALAIADILLRVAGIVAIGYVIYGGFRYMISQGEPEATKTAQGTVINALIGLAIAVLSTAVVSFIGSNLWK